MLHLFWPRMATKDGRPKIGPVTCMFFAIRNSIEAIERRVWLLSISWGAAQLPCALLL